MTVDSELRRIWRHDLQRIESQLVELRNAVAMLELQVSTHHPRIEIDRPQQEAHDQDGP